MSEVTPASTVILLRDSERGLEVLLLRRSKKVSFAGGSWVFPGGKIDAEDYAADKGDVESAARVAAVRETMEEAGIAIEASRLEYISHWTTPEQAPRRFATWFYICKVDSDLAVTVDNGEIDSYRWCQPSEAVADQQRKHIEMMPPTLITLSELAANNTAEQALAM